MKTLTDRFWPKVSRADVGCWEWTGSKDRDGYGRIRIGDRPVMAHRVSYEMHHGEIPDGAVVMHSCDNPACVRPTHLKIGSQADNITDRHLKGRTIVPVLGGSLAKKAKMGDRRGDRDAEKKTAG